MSVEIILIGPGLVGSAVLQLLDGYSKLRPVIVTRVVSSKISYTHTNTSRSISDLDDASIIKEHRPAAQIDPRLLHPQPSGSYRSIIMVDCTSSADVVAMYEDWLSHGDCHIVTANKKGISSEWELYSRLMNLSTCEIPSHNLFLFEASVGWWKVWWVDGLTAMWCRCWTSCDFHHQRFGYDWGCGGGCGGSSKWNVILSFQ